MCVSVCVTYTHVHITCLTLSLFTLVPETGPLTEPGTNSQPVGPGILLSQPPQCQGYSCDTRNCAWLFMGVLDIHTEILMLG